MIAPRALLIGLTLAAVAVAAAAAEAPAKRFERSCAPCHGKAGRPNAVFAKQGVRDFTDPLWQKGVTDAAIEQSIRQGKQGTLMAGFGGQLSPAEIKALRAYIRTLGKK